VRAPALWLLLGAVQAGAPSTLRPLAAEQLATPVLALAFAAPDELVVLSPGGVSHYRLQGPRLALVARRSVEVTGPPARHPGGLLLSEPGARSVWALASGWPRALLLDLDARLEIRSEAEALPWPGARDGVRLRPGTSLLEAELPGLGPSPFLALAPGAALGAEARLRRTGAAAAAGDAAARIGTPLAGLPGGALLAGSAAAPGEPDALLLLDETGAPPRVVRDALPGALRALAATTARDRRVRCVLAVDTEAGFRLFALDLERQP
jgi:hypothetical protein